MPAQAKCPECGAALATEVPHGLCPKCLIRMGLAPAAATESDPTLRDPAPLEQQYLTERIGRYKILQKLGEGGCGVVYMAEQEEPVKRRVALKVIKLGMDSRQVVARFEAERQALALMDHPHIAKVLDGGTTETGQPFFVMELVRGTPITRYCDENRLDTTQRLELFILVCQAVQHAHQKGIIHRDIKPSNILVADHDGTPVPKVIDFGIAKATAGQTLTDKTLFTAFEQFLGTPAYMSPEQAKLSGLDIDTRSDIYSLGVLLYELLTGKTPFEARRLMQAGLEEICRIIREEEPPRPSTRLSTLEASEQTTLARQRQSQPPKLLHLVRGDLDWIVMRTLEKDRNRRYETANGLATDLRRFLSQEPVVARPPSNLYRFQKLVRRNKLAFGAALAIGAALLLGLGISTWLFLRERAARQQAVAAEKKSNLDASKSQQVAQFLKDMLSGVGPSVAKGRDTAMLREILDKTAERVGKDLPNQPEVEMELRGTLARTYSDLSLYQRAEEMARGSLDLGRARLGPEHPAVATALAILGAVVWHSGKMAEAASFTREALALQRKLLGNENTNVANSLNILGNALSRLGKLTEAEEVCREALTIQRKLLGNENVDVALTLGNLGNVLSCQVKLAEAETTQREVLVMQRKLLGNEHPDVARTLADLASVLDSERKFVEAETLQRESLAMEKKLEGADHRDVALGLCNLGQILQGQGKLAEAETAVREALTIQKKVLGQEHPELAVSMSNLAVVLEDQHQLPEAESIQRQALAMQRRLFGNEHPDVAVSLDNLADILKVQGKLSEAEATQREELAIQRKLRGSEHPYVAASLGDLAKILVAQGKLPEAETMQREALAMQMKLLGSEHPDVADALDDLAITLKKEGKWPEAEAVYRKALAIQRKLLGNEHVAVAASLSNIGEVLDSQGRMSEAETTYREALAMRRRLLGSEHPDAVTSLNLLIDLLQRQKKYDEAERVLSELLTTENARTAHSAELLSSRGGLFARRERWSEAAADLTNAIALDPSIQLSYHLLAPVLLEFDDAVGYRHYGAEGLKRFGQTTDPQIAERMAKACLILPTSDLETISRLADLAVTADTNHWAWHYFEFVKGLAEYRGGHLESAADWMRRVLTATGDDVNRDVEAYMVLAMAHAKLGRTEEARVTFAKGVDIADRNLAKPGSGDLGDNWNDWVIVRLLMREAKLLIDPPLKAAEPK